MASFNGENDVGSVVSTERYEDYLNINETEEFLCYFKQQIEEKQPNGGCQTYWDSVLCWPATPPGTAAVLPCFAELHGIKYDVTQNATRYCHKNGTWDNYTDYSACTDVNTPEESGIEVTSLIYYGGYTLSLVALSLAVWIFLYFKDLRCLRNTIHINLMCTYMLAALMWILTLTLQLATTTDYTTCVFLVILLHYFHLTNFFWMLVEGLYLYMLVVETFKSENIKLRVYVLIGWAGPAIFITIWVIVKSVNPVHGTESLPGVSSELESNCPWMREHVHDWLFKAPATAVLVINLLFLIRIMWVLITKLRSANTLETQQYRKATKALLVLIPLLGITYILVIMGPSAGVFKHIFDYSRAILLSTQGFTVALFYCFLNTEVQNTMRHHLERWRTERSLGSRRYNNCSKDWSPRSRTIRLNSLYYQPSHVYRKRESTVSETTTTTVLGYHSGGINPERVAGTSNNGRKISTSVSPFLQPDIAEHSV